MPKNLIIGALVALLAALSVITFATAQRSTTEVELRVWRSASDHTRIYYSARPAEGKWGKTLRVNFPDTTVDERWDYEDFDVAIPLGDDATPVPQDRYQFEGRGTVVRAFHMPSVGDWACRLFWTGHSWRVIDPRPFTAALRRGGQDVTFVDATTVLGYGDIRVPNYNTSELLTLHISSAWPSASWSMTCTR